MQFKIDTKTNHRLINVSCEVLNDQLAEEISQISKDLIATPPGNLIFLFTGAAQMDATFPDKLAALQASVYERDHSIVFTGLDDALLKQCRNSENGDTLNVTPTLEEAVDIVSMEVLERDLLNEEE